MPNDEIITEETVIVAESTEEPTIIEKPATPTVETQLEEIRAQMAALIVQMEEMRNERTISDTGNDRATDDTGTDGGTTEEAERASTEGNDVRPRPRHWYYKKRF